MLDRTRVIREFENYVAGYDASDPKIKLKIDHTLRVASLCQKISGHISAENAGWVVTENTGQAGAENAGQVVTENIRQAGEETGGQGVTKNTRQAGEENAAQISMDPDLIWLCGMLHDIGRFEQVRCYNTFSDAASVDHASFGADLLFREGLLELFCPEINPEDRVILEKAIRNHSAYRLDPELTQEEVLYCSILRDADKIDIFRVNCDTPREDIYNVTTRELVSSPVSEEVKQCFDRHTAVLRNLKKYPADYIVGHICLMFELVFPVSRKIAKEQGYIQQLLAFESENEDTRKWFMHMRPAAEAWLDR